MVASAEFDPVIVDAEFTAARLRELIAYARESAKLDYKVGYDPSARIDRIEVAKDLVAMANTAGGYIVVGVADDGTIVGGDPVALTAIDEAVVRAQVQGYIGTSIELFVNSPVLLDGKHFGVLTVLKSNRSPIVFQKDGQYSQGSGKSKVVFGVGDVFVRHGSASERWNQADVGTIYARVIDREKEKWLKDMMPDVRRLIEGALHGQGAPAEPRELVAQDAASFEKVASLIAKGLLP